jgi:predicted helicase
MVSATWWRASSTKSIVDLGADVRANPKLSGTRHNVFGIQTGVAIGFLVKRAKAQGCRIFYSRRPEFETAEEKLAWLSKARFDAIERGEIRPDAKHNWLNLTDNDFDTLIPVGKQDREGGQKAVAGEGDFQAVFSRSFERPR